ncbi:hypothetical protein Kpol_461p5 [Vanderwaltozyma polyspora DSM 70294]|uniref:DASH complex subunit DUO1 n=1 Tax=Vanderwaltozyma polyspora (strain ATCC 22028 / DSM 70294 / BCRC 21397 / CBS 2163 / NBRC 10782 / NRRL Y-8283 / UCD 57-17) TaxID=436907 RepID=A7TR42_VANPO|nr:uncharacterized protein Kpol_461p5 [Vanderwaltozyma polyspora DSM 70294]EDO15252.1 hypothetical protein Kpol_461p5 [Vanderwaltozyma polyspora DSM 70294]
MEDTSNIEKLIPAMFDQMRSNLGSSKNSAGQPVVTTQSLLKELEVLDKLVPLIEHIDVNLRNALPSHLEKIQETCKSTNMILDSWINIHSQAGYVHKLMDTSQGLGLDLEGKSVNERLLQETKEVEELKKQLILEEQKQNEKTMGHTGRNGAPISGRRVPPSSRYGRPPYRSAQSNSRLNPRATGIPNISSRITKPTASSSRKMFR